MTPNLVDNPDLLSDRLIEALGCGNYLCATAERALDILEGPSPRPPGERKAIQDLRRAVNRWRGRK